MFANIVRSCLAGCIVGLLASPISATAEVGEDTLKKLVARARSEQVRLGVDADVSLKSITCTKLGASGRVCVGQFVYGIVFKILVRNDVPILLQLVVSMKTVQNRKNVGRAINAFMIFTPVGHTQERLDVLMMAALSCVARATAAATNVGTLTFESTGTGCVIGYEMGN
jgi:hypothetical protein